MKYYLKIRKLENRNKEKFLTPIENKILLLLFNDEIVTFKVLDYVTNGYRTHICRMRKKYGLDIRIVVGLGYRLCSKIEVEV